MKDTERTALIAEARKDLGIDVPIYRIDIDPETESATLHFYGGRKIIRQNYTPPDTPDDLTKAAGVGKKTAQALNAMDITTFDQLARAYCNQNTYLTALMSDANFDKLGDWLTTEGYITNPLIAES